MVSANQTKSNPKEDAKYLKALADKRKLVSRLNVKRVAAEAKKMVAETKAIKQDKKGLEELG